jgi:hypothetical protein
MLGNEVLNMVDLSGLQAACVCKNGGQKEPDDYGEFCCREKMQTDAKGKQNCRVATGKKKKRTPMRDGTLAGGRARGGGGGGCEDPVGLAKCLADAAINAAMDLTPGLGLIKGLVGFKAGFLSGSSGFDGLPDEAEEQAGALTDAAEEYSDWSFNNQGGQSELDRLNGYNRPNSRLSERRFNLRNLSAAKKALGSSGAIFVAKDTYEYGKGCIDAHCK